MNKRIYLSILILLCLAFAQAYGTLMQEEEEEQQEETTVKQEEAIHTAPFPEGYESSNEVYPHYFEEGYRDKYKAKKYDYTQSPPRRSIKDRIVDLLTRLLNSIFGFSDAANASKFILWLSRILAVGIVGLTAYFLLRYFMQKTGTWIFEQKDGVHGPALHGITENIHEMDLPKLIKKYEGERNYRAATRFWFLLLLKRMVDKELLVWDREKTNKEYMEMLKGRREYESFRKLAFIFENIWYGEREVFQAEYEGYKKEYRETIGKL